MEGYLIVMIFWIFVFIATLLLELFTQELISLWFCIGTIPAIIMSAFKVEFQYQILVYALVSAVLFILSELFIRKKLKSKDKATNVIDSLIGEKILIIKDVKPLENGEGKVRDIVWTVKSKDEISSGEYAIVKEIKGNSLVVEKGDK